MQAYMLTYTVDWDAGRGFWRTQEINTNPGICFIITEKVQSWKETKQLMKWEAKFEPPERDVKWTVITLRNEKVQINNH